MTKLVFLQRVGKAMARYGLNALAGGLPLGGLVLERVEDVAPLLPAALPRFKPGDRPPGLGDWELEELLGVGGFGEVWKAKNPYLPEPVALKFCLDPDSARMLRNEAEMLGRV